jgi:ABC-type multidrug transport system fused ATPase/permease subunit
VFRYLSRHWKLVTVSVTLIVLGTLVGLLVPWPMMFIVDNVLSSQPMPPTLAWLLGPIAQSRTSLLVLTVVAGFVLVLVQNGLSVLDSYVNTKIDQNMVLDFRSDLFRHAQRLSLAFHDQRRSGMLIYVINFQADAVARVIMAIPPLAQSALTLVGMVWISYKLDSTLSLLSLTVVPFLYYAVHFYIKHIQLRLGLVLAAEGESLSIIHEAISMLRVIVAFGREDHEYGRFRRQGEATIRARIRVTVWQTLFSLAVNLTTAAGAALVLGFGAYHVMKGRLTLGQLLIILAYIAAIYKPLETISSTIGSLQQVFVALAASFQLLDTPPEIHDERGAVDIGRVRGDLAFEGVCFNYSSRIETLRDISFDVKAGQVVAIVGPTGAGKTTLMSLVPRFYDLKRGRILLDGRNIRTLTLRALREQISVVLQEPLLFSGKIAENIRYGKLDATMDEIMEAARSANAHDFITGLPNQYDTELGERGVQLSGGERQRIAVARAFLKDAPILILDEPTSSIDSKTEAVILDALDRLMVGRTTFMIAHRLSTIRRADVILVLDHGRLVERGSHQELLRRGGLYKQLHEIQTRLAARRAARDLAAVADPDGAEDYT